jgi:hypothetical protein
MRRGALAAWTLLMCRSLLLSMVLPLTVPCKGAQGEYSLLGIICHGILRWFPVQEARGTGFKETNMDSTDSH